MNEALTGGIFALSYLFTGELSNQDSEFYGKYKQELILSSTY